MTQKQIRKSVPFFLGLSGFMALVFVLIGMETDLTPLLWIAMTFWIVFLFLAITWVLMWMVGYGEDWRETIDKSFQKVMRERERRIKDYEKENS